MTPEHTRLAHVEFLSEIVFYCWSHLLLVPLQKTPDTLGIHHINQADVLVMKVFFVEASAYAQAFFCVIQCVFGIRQRKTVKF